MQLKDIRPKTPRSFTPNAIALGKLQKAIHSFQFRAKIASDFDLPNAISA